jgi:signal transduction histidine kinase
MRSKTNTPLEVHIARCRVILSVVALAAVYVDPTAPYVASWMKVSSGRFTIDPYVFVVMGVHLLYSLAVYSAAVRGSVTVERLTSWTVVADVVIGGAIALVTEGATSPFSAFFMFAVVVAGFRSGLRQAMIVTAASVSVYLGMILISAPGRMNVYIMRPAYLAIVGYLVGYLGQHRLKMQRALQSLEAAEQRHRIARDLHDGFVQALAGINLRLEGCRRLLERRDDARAMTVLTDLQSSVSREYDDLREYMVNLAGVHSSPAATGAPRSTQFSLDIRVDGPIDLMDHVLQIAREGLSNVRRHAEAASAAIRVSVEDSKIRIVIEDDGVGLKSQTAPWSIASRVDEVGGDLQLADSKRGSRMQILLPHLGGA